MSTTTSKKRQHDDHTTPRRDSISERRARCGNHQQARYRSLHHGVASYINQDFLRWNAFDKCARVANHSDVGVIE